LLERGVIMWLGVKTRLFSKIFIYSISFSSRPYHEVRSI